MKELYCIEDKLTELDVKSNTKLTHLECNKNQLTNLALSKNTELTYINCADNQLTTLDLSKNTKLTFIDCRNNQLTNLALTNNTNLETLHCRENQLTNLVLTNTTNLKNLQCQQNQLTNLDLSHTTNLEILNCDNNKLTALNLSKNTALTEIFCDNNQLSALDLSENTNLKILYCQQNKLTTLDLTNKTNLEDLYCDQNQLTTLDLSKNTNLKFVDCHQNQLTTLDLKNNTNLKALSCDQNQLTTLDLKNNTKLSTLYCAQNQLTTLDLSKNTKLTLINCSQNQLTTLDLKNNTNLNTLYCAQNQLTNLDLSKNTELTYIVCSMNDLTTLDLKNNTKLKDLYCNDNKLTNLDLSHNSEDIRLNGSNQKYDIKVSASTLKFDLQSLPGNFNPSMASDWDGGVVSGNTLTLNDASTTKVEYIYKVNNGDKKINVTLNVKYGDVVTVTFNKNGKGGDPATIVKTIDKGSKVEKPSDPTDEQYDFGGWYKEAECANKFDFNTSVNESTTLYAKWTKKTPPAVEQVTVKFLPGEGATGSMEDVKVDKNSEYTLPASTFTPPVNKEFKAWKFGEEEKPVGSKINVGETDITLTAIWKDTTPNPPVVEQVKVKFLPGEGATGSMEDVKVDKNSEYTLPASTFTPPVNKEFKAWQYNNEEKPVGSKINVGETDITLTAIWKETPPTGKVTITYDPNGGNWNGDTTVFIQEVDKNQTTAVKEAPTKDGYTFKGWMNSVDQKTYQPGVDYHITETVTFTAQWEKNQSQPTGKVTITFDPNGGTGEMKPVEVDSNSTYNLPECKFNAPPNKEFDNWSYNGVAVAVGTAIKVEECNITLTAIWKDQTTPTPVGKVTISFAPGEGSGTMNPVKVDSNSKYKLPACEFTAPPNKEFDKWSYDVAAGEVGTEITVGEKDITLTALWKKTTTPPTPPEPPIPPTPPTPDPYYPGYDPYYPGYYDDWYEPYRPHRPYRPYRPVEVEEKTEVTKNDREELILKVILTENSKELEKYINAVKSITLMDVAPYIKDGRIMLPIRFVSEALGMNVGWDNETRTVIIQDMFYRVEIPVDTNNIIVNGITYTSDVMPEIKNDRTMMPIANIARALGLVDGKDIFWDGATRKATIIRKLQNN